MQSGQKRVTLDEIWPDVEKGVGQLIRQFDLGLTKPQYIALYTNVYNYCTTTRPPNQKSLHRSTGHGGANFVGEDLYNRLRELLKTHVRGLQRDADTRMDDALLQYYLARWREFTVAMKVVNNLFQYLNRHWIKREAEDGKKEIFEVYTLSLVLWRDYFFHPLKQRLTRAVLALVEKEREQEKIDHALVKGVVESYVALGLNKDKPKENTLDVYKQHFEGPFLDATEVYYAQKSNAFINANSVAEYMQRVERWLSDESKRCHDYLHPDTEAEQIRKCLRVLVRKHAEHMINDYQRLLEDDKLDDLGRMFALLSRVALLDELKSGFERHVHTVGVQSIESVAATAINDPEVYVEALLRVYRKYNDMVVGPFRGDSGFVASLDRACKRFINDNAVCKEAKAASKSPELVAKFCDNMLKKSAKIVEESEMESRLTDVMVVFKYVEDKDVFQSFYSKQLAKRLIHGTSASEDLEGQMIGKLKSTCGYEYTSKLQRMFSDMGQSKALQEKFKTSLDDEKKDALPLDFSLLVLATGSWPLQPPTTNFIMPRELTTCAEAFQEFYSKQHSARRLTWLHQFSKGEIKTKLGGKIYLFQASTYQMGVLLLFNTQQRRTVGEVQQATQLTDQALRSAVLTLVKCRVLLLVGQDDDSTELEKSTVLTVNNEFKNKRNRVNVNVPFREEEKKLSDETHKRLEEDRKLQIQAAIVRIMKMRKRLAHQGLIAEVMEQLQTRFKPRIASIKRAVDILIEKEYLERVEDAKDVYAYLA